MIIIMYRYPPYLKQNHFSYHEESHTKKTNNTSKDIKLEEDVEKISLLGFSISFDDLLIIVLLLILYNEKSSDKGVFFCLVLLLLS